MLPGWLRTPRTLRWFTLGVAATALNLALLYILVSGLDVSFRVAPVISAEVGIVLRYLGNDRWVFGHARPTWRRFWQFHVAVAGGFVVWWATSNLLVFVGVHYMLAALLAIGGSLGLNLITNFNWIWRGHKPVVAAKSDAGQPDQDPTHETTLVPPR